MSTSSELKPRSKSPYRITLTDDEGTNQLIRDLVKKRAIVKGRLTRFSNYVNGFKSDEILPSQTQIDLKLRMQGATNLYAEFSLLQTQIEESVLDVDLEEQLLQRDGFEDSYYSTLARAESLIKKDEVTSACSKRCHSHSDSIKLPTISVPTFDGSCGHWLEFRDTFQSLVHESTHISSIQKFHYLKSSLKGSAALVIDSVEFSADNYSVAWELLLNRFNNNKLLVHSHIKALFTLQTLTKEAPDLLRNLIDSYLKNLRALKILGEPVDSWDTILIYIIVSKLDKTTERAWEQYRNTILNKSEDSTSRLKIDSLLTFLKDRADMLDTLQANVTKTNDNNKKLHSHINSKVHCNVSSTKSKPQMTQRSCLLCKSNHSLYACNKFLELDLNSRIKFVHDNKLCENCLRPGGHSAVDCRFGPCRKCDKKHNSLICNKSSDSNNSVVTQAVPSEDKRPLVMLSSLAASTTSHLSTKQANLPTGTSCAQYPCVQRVLLSTALVEVCDKYNNYRLARTLLDSGSERCLIKKSLCEILNIPVIQSAQEIRGVGNSVTQATLTCDIEIKSRTSSYTTRLQCIVLPNITSAFPALPIQDTQLKIPSNLQLADPDFYESQSIDILIGADKFWELLSQGKIRLPTGPILQNTQLGWIISGPVHINTRSTGHVQCNFSQAVSDQLRLFWEIEELPKPCDTRTEEEKACEDHFVKTTTRNNDGRFCVNIPLKLSPLELGETLPQAINRFKALENRLQRVPDYKKMYSDFIHEYENLGHMTRIDKTKYGTPHYFMPHHGVFREHSVTTKLRVVFDASFTSSTSVSLNNIQRVGPPIQGDLLAILLRFRQHKYVACADVEKMYRQILIAEDQRDLQLIVWRDNPSDPLSVFRLNTVVYGTASAPFLAVRCLKELGLTCSDPDVKRVIMEDFFVDDMITGLDDKDELTKLCENIYNVLQSGCFPLRKWIFNYECDQSIFNGIKQLNLDGKSECKTLGIGWNNSTDEFNYNTQFKNDTKTSKRTILSHVSQIFDPLGLLSPAIIVAKILLQKLWLEKTDWDDALPQEVIEAWNRFAISLSALNNINVPRHVIGLEPTSIELHIFTDASQAAYGACAYVRTITIKNEICSRLLCAKAKVAPVKPLTIPRLELSGAVLGARLYKKISESLHCKFNNVVFWTDSTIILGWLRTAPSLLKTFVQNRVVEILEITGDLPWRHVSGKENPADMASRGILLNDLASSTRWWEGPQFLHDLSFDYTNITTESGHDLLGQELPEVKSSSVLICTQEPELFPFSRFSQFSRMKRSFAYVLRFIHNARNYKVNRITGALTPDEVRKAELGLAKLSQTEAYSEEYKFIKNNNMSKLKSALSKLNLFIDKTHKLIRVGGRIMNANQYDFNKMHPILLDSNHRFTVLLLRHEHKRLLHVAPQALLYEVRQQWWPIRGRNLARQIVHECILCKRLKGNTLHPLMGNLPQERITPAHPFLICGVDYAGPVFTLNRKGRGARTVKSYICLFICFVTRAVHLELVSDLTSESYILALKRFISRRSRPNVISSDNGRNFVGAMNEFGKFLTRCSDDISAYATSQNITFKFIPAYSPHFGGLWEAGVKSTKYHLTRVIGNAHLTFEEFTTVLTQIEAILNSRPLSPMSSDPQDFLPLSPAHFLVGRSLTAPVYEDMRNDTGTQMSRYQRVEQMRHHFWERWSKEYISELQTRCKWMSGADTLQPGMMVVIKDDNLPPLKWHLGRISSTVPGKDGISRVADIRTASGVVRRSFAKICPLFPEEPTKST